MKIDSEKVATELVQKIDNAQGDANGMISSISGGYTNIIGTAAFSGATADAVQTKVDEFSQHWTRLNQILDDLKAGVRKAAGLLADQDHGGARTVQAVSVGGGSAMASNFGSRMA